ncbi:MAG: HIT family protein [Thermoplasmata archaeon]
MNENCVFCDIAAGKLPSYKVYEDREILGFLDINPLAPGHTLIIPKKHYVDVFDIPADNLKSIAEVAQIIAKKIRESGLGQDVNLFNASGVSAEQSVFHFHIHVIPRNPTDSIGVHGWWNPKVVRLRSAEMESASRKLSIE